jgi:polar amino acid transport system substrate-binding protein
MNVYGKFLRISRDLSASTAWKLACAIVLVISIPAVGECSKRAAWASNPPYLVRAEDGVVHGVHADLLREALRRLNCRIDFVEMPWARSLVELKAGRVDMLAGAADTPERKQFAYFSRPTNTARNVLFMRREAITKYRLQHLADIVGTDFLLGVTNMVAYGGDYDELIGQPGFAARLVRVNDRDQGWKMIAAGRLDGQIDDELTGLVEIQRLKLADNIQMTGLVVDTQPDLVAFSKASTSSAFVDAFNRAIAAMVADGSFKTIFERNAPCKVSAPKPGCDGTLKP